MEIREVTTQNEKAPFTGYGVWIVFEMKYRKVRLLHPTYLSEMVLDEYEFVKECGSCLWPFNNTGKSFNLDKFKSNFKERIKFFIENEKPFPLEVVCRVLSELDETSIAEAKRYINSLAIAANKEAIDDLYSLDKNEREFQLRQGADYSNIGGRPLSIIEALRDNGPATMNKITELVDGKLKTKSKLSRVVTYFVNKLTSQGILEIVT